MKNLIADQTTKDFMTIYNNSYREFNEELFASNFVFSNIFE